MSKSTAFSSRLGAQQARGHHLRAGEESPEQAWNHVARKRSFVTESKKPLFLTPHPVLFQRPQEAARGNKGGLERVCDHRKRNPVCESYPPGRLQICSVYVSSWGIKLFHLWNLLPNYPFVLLQYLYVECVDPGKAVILYSRHDG